MKKSGENISISNWYFHFIVPFADNVFLDTQLLEQMDFWPKEKEKPAKPFCQLSE